MNVNERVKKAVSVLLCLCMLLQNVPVGVLAAEGDCTHHAEHTEACGYEEGLTDCTFQCGECAAATISQEPEETTVPETTEEAVSETTEATEPSTEPTEETEPEIVCTCESDDPAFHATFCALYEAPENPQCFCAEKCSEPNFWCDVCGFDISRCGGEDTAATYDEPCPHTVTVELEDLGGNYQENSNQDYRSLVDGNKNTKWCNEFGAAGKNYVIFTTGEPVVIASYTLTTASDTASFPKRNWKSWVLSGSTSRDGPWNTIHSVEDGRLPAENSKDSDPFQVDYHSHRAFFKLELNAINSEEPSELHQMAEITIRKSAMVKSVCTECQTPCPHDIWKGVNCMRCGIYCLHENYSDGACTGCGLKCPHENYNGGICDLCKWECPHTGTYEDGTCTVCGNTCEHPAESIQDSTCQLCGWVCSHVAVLPVGVAGTSGVNASEGYDRLIDGDIRTKWCSPDSKDGSKAYIILKYDRPQALQSYFMITGDDASQYPERNWADWTLYGSDNGQSDWTEVHKVSGQNLPTQSKTPSEIYSVNASAQYPYYKLEVDAIKGGGDLQQMTEMCLNTSMLVGDNGSFSCLICQKTFDQCPHHYRNELCVLCGLICSHKWEGGVCTDCGMKCSHAWTQGTCYRCGAPHDHAPEDFTNGKCGICLYVCTHDRPCGFCGICGAEVTTHTDLSEEGFCSACGGYQKAEYNSTTNCWEISNAGQLFWFSQDCSKDQYAFRSVLLTADIDLTDCPDWIPILGKDGHPFYGTFDGGGHTITGLHIDNDAPGRKLGLFGIIGDANTTVKNLRFSKASIINAGHKDCSIGTLAGINRGVVENVHILDDCFLLNRDVYDGGHLINDVGGIAGINEGTIRTSRNYGRQNWQSLEWYVGGRYSGGIAGQNRNGGIIENCINQGVVRSNDDAGGIAGLNGGTIKNCWGNSPYHAYNRVDTGDGKGDYFTSFGTIYSIAKGGQIINCYADRRLTDENSTNYYSGKDATSGKLTYLLQNYYEQEMGGEDLLWGQNVDNGNPPDEFPVLFGTTRVYQHQDCVGNYFYSNISEPETLHLVYENGMCKACHLIEKVPERDDEGVYLIGNAGQLLWFAEKCKEVGHGRFNARLTADIVVNENALSGTPAIAWPVIENFWGDFNGDGHTISGLYVVQTDGESAGMFAYVQAGGGFDGTIRNLRVADSYISGTGAVGGIVGNLATSGTVENCSFSGTVVCTDGVTVGTYNYEYAGGLVGRNVGTVENSYANAAVICDGNAKGAGGLVGHNTGSLDNCYFNSNTFLGYPSGNDTCNGESTFQDWHLDHFEEDRTAQQFASGEVAYLMQRYYEEKMDGENLLWGQTIGINPYPIFVCSRVLEAKDCQGNTCYSNTNDVVHYYGADDICTKCSHKFCAHSVTAQLAYVSGSKGYGNEEDQNLLDGNEDTKWCAKFEADGANYVVFSAGDGAVITSYTLTTADDTGSNSGRNWKSWTLYGSNRADGGWVLIDQVKDAGLPAANHAVSDGFTVDRPGPYTYYKLVLNAIEVAGTTSHQMADITVQKLDFHDGVCTQCEFECTHTGNYVEGICKICKVAHDHVGETFQDGVGQVCGWVCDHKPVGSEGKCPCGIEAAAYAAFYSLSLKGDIGINFYMHIDETVQDGYMKFTTPRGGEVEVPFSQATPKVVEGKTYYRFTAYVAAKEMTDTITGQYVYEGGSSEAYEYSIRQYADIIINNEAGSETYEKVKPMIEAMLNYGAYTQMDFGYNTDNLACEVTDVSDVTADTLSRFAKPGKQGTALASLYASTLVLKAETTLRLYFQLDPTVSDFTVTRNGSRLATVNKSGLTYAALENISAKNLDDDYTVTVNDGKETAEVTYNPMTYCYNVLNAEKGTYEESLLNVVRALYLYNQAANDYFEN